VRFALEWGDPGVITMKGHRLLVLVFSAALLLMTTALTGFVTGFIYAQPDLKVTDFIANWQAKRGERIDFSFSVENAGDAASESCYWAVYISSGAYYAGTRIASGTIYALDPGASDRCGGSGDLPSDLEPGYYYLYAVADDGDYVNDSDRSNNTTWMRFQVLEDASTDATAPITSQPSSR
jgi:hypothetical protein